ncbi:MAG: DUF350 domain-containing protein [Oligoflexia bacterium]|nr:DUF350 domain-containing protein [Oligoflexia bacterium]
MISTIIYSIIGIVIFCISYYIFERISPFSIKKEIIEDQNIALGVIMGCFVIGISIIVSSAIK